MVTDCGNLRFKCLFFVLSLVFLLVVGVVVVGFTVFIAFVRLFVSFIVFFFFSFFLNLFSAATLILLRLCLFSFSLMFIRKYNYLDNTVDLDYTEQSSTRNLPSLILLYLVLIYASLYYTVLLF